MKLENKSQTLVEFIRLLKSQQVNERKTRELIGDFLEGKARERLVPLHGFLELTPLCNLDCKMCYIHIKEDEYNRNSLLSSDSWIDIIAQGQKSGMRHVTLTGGECLTHPGFFDICQFVHKSGLKLSIISNGILFDEKCIDFLRKLSLGSIQISLYGSSEDAYEKVTGHRVFEIVYKNILAIRDSGLPLQIAITPSQYMRGDLENIITLVEALNIKYEINCKLVTPRDNTNREIEDLSLSEYVEMYKLRAEYHQSMLTPIDPSELPNQNYIGKERKGLYCGAGRSAFAINCKGEMMACTSLSEYSVPILEGGFAATWQKINEYVLNYSTPCECDGCAYFSICIHCQGLHKSAKRGHCNPQICERTKKLVEIGFYQKI